MLHFCYINCLCVLLVNHELLIYTNDMKCVFYPIAGARDTLLNHSRIYQSFVPKSAFEMLILK